MYSTSRFCFLLACILSIFSNLFAISAKAAASDQLFNVVDYGARNDGSASATEAFRAAIAAAKQAGGGTVYVPAGTYVTGPIDMVSNLTLYIDAGATLRFPAMKLPLTPGRQQGVETLTPMPLIGGHDLENVAVIGRGTLTSNNEDWMALHNRALRSVTDVGSANGPNWEHLLLDLNAHKPISEEEYKAAAAELRPSFIRFMNSKNILIDGLHFVGSPMWTIHLLYSENAVVQNVVIETFPGVHADGIVVDSSRFVKILNDYIDTGDDGIVLKAGKDADGLRVDRPTEDVAISNCTVHHAQGAVAIGSETSGSVRNVVASNLTVKDTVNGIHIKSRRGRGGVVENISFDNWTMENVGAAITVSDAGYQMEGEPPDPGEGPVTKQTPVLRNIAINNIIVDGANSLINVEGIPEMPISGLRISNVSGSGKTGLRAKYTDNMLISNVQMIPESGPGFEVSDSTNLELIDVSMPKPLKDTPMIRLESIPGAVIRDSKAYPGTGTFLSITPNEFKNVMLEGNVTGGASMTVSADAKEDWPAAAPVTRELCLVQFPWDPESLTAVDQQSKICLDIIARTLQRTPGASIALISDPLTLRYANVGKVKAERDLATERATNSRNYLVHERDIDPSRVRLYLGPMESDGPENIDKIEAEMVAGRTVDGNVETVLVPKGSVINGYGLTSIK